MLAREKVSGERKVSKGNKKRSYLGGNECLEGVKVREI